MKTKQLSESAIRSRLYENARDVDIKLYSEIDSTNSEARRLSQKRKNGAVLIVAEQQSSGRGRLGRSFFSPAGAGIYMTYLWYPDAAAVDVVSVTTAASVAVLRAMKSMPTLAEKDLTIKWVNDIYLSGKKVCGILTEAVTDPEEGKVKSVWVGIGINVHQTAFPEELAEIATSLDVADLDRNELIANILNEWIAILQDLDPYAHMSYYREHSLIIGKQVNTICAGVAVPGVVVDIDPQGGLVVRRSDGRIETIHSGEVSLCFI